MNKMIEKDAMRTLASVNPSPRTPVEHGASEARIAARVSEELDAIIGKSQRRSPLRRGLRAVGGALVRLLERMVPEAPPQSDLPPQMPPQIKFPFF